MNKFLTVAVVSSVLALTACGQQDSVKTVAQPTQTQTGGIQTEPFAIKNAYVCVTDTGVLLHTSYSPTTGNLVTVAPQGRNVTEWEFNIPPMERPPRERAFFYKIKSDELNTDLVIFPDSGELVISGHGNVIEFNSCRMIDA